MLDPERYRLVKTVRYTYKDIALYDCFSDSEIENKIYELQELGYIVEVGDTTKLLLKPNEAGEEILYSVNLILYMTHDKYEQEILRDRRKQERKNRLAQLLEEQRLRNEAKNIKGCPPIAVKLSQAQNKKYKDAKSKLSKIKNNNINQ